VITSSPLIPPLACGLADQSSARVRLRDQLAEACREPLQPSPCQGFAQASRGLMVARGGRMIAAIGIGIVIIIAVIVAALAIIYFVLKGSPR
jgi:hypothetical protein